MSNHGFSDSEWELAKKETKSILFKLAKKKKLIFYSDLVEKIHSIEIATRDPRLSDLLSEISTKENMEGRGMLTAIVVSKNEGIPRRGFSILAEKLGKDASNKESCRIKELNKVYECRGNS